VPLTRRDECGEARPGRGKQRHQDGEAERNRRGRRLAAERKECERECDGHDHSSDEHRHRPERGGDGVAGTDLREDVLCAGATTTCSVSRIISGSADQLRRHRTADDFNKAVNEGSTRWPESVPLASNRHHDVRVRRVVLELTRRRWAKVRR